MTVGSIHGDSANTSYVPDEKDIASSRIGGALILGGVGGLLFTEARSGGMACATMSEKCEQLLSTGEKAAHVGEEAVEAVTEAMGPTNPGDISF